MTILDFLSEFQKRIHAKLPEQDRVLTLSDLGQITMEVSSLANEHKDEIYRASETTADEYAVVDRTKGSTCCVGVFLVEQK